MNNNKKTDVSDAGFMFAVIGIFLLIVWIKHEAEIVSFYYKWRYLIALVITAALVATYIKLRDAILVRSTAKDLENEILEPKPDEDFLFAGFNPRGKRIYVKLDFRRMHTQIVGTTNAGKTESVILPWAIDDIKKGRGFIIIDGKSDRSLLDKLYAYAKKYHREQDVKILSLCDAEISHTFNPLTNGSALEICERVFAAFTFENEYFKSIQYDAFLHCLLLLCEAKIKPTPCRMIECLKSEKQLASLANKACDARLKDWAKDFLGLKREEREQRTSGLVAQLQNFAVGETAAIFNSEHSDIDLERALENGEIIYCQLPALKIPTLGKVTGKIILQCLQSAVSTRHLGRSTNNNFFSVYLDDFTEYLTPSFATLLNKSRSANVGIVFAHQALGDLAELGEGVQNTILTNSNLKIFMRTNEPNSAEYFSSVIGTTQTSKVTERQKDGLMGAKKTGDGSIREAEEFKFHPNHFKQKMGVGEAVMIIPHSKGSLPVEIKFKKCLDLDRPVIPKLKKSESLWMPLDAVPAENNQSAHSAVADIMSARSA